jgi:hypothetical protein
MTRRFFVAVAIAMLVGSLSARAEDRLLAVLEIKSKLSGAEAASVDASYLTNVVRSAALEALPGLRVMTRENMVVLVQASGKALADCEGECEVDTGRRLGADLIVSGELLKFGTRYKLDLRMHDVRDGRLLAGGQASGRTIDELDEATGAAVKKLFTVLQAPGSAAATVTAAGAKPGSSVDAGVAAQAAAGAKSLAAAPSLSHALELRAEAIRNAVFLESKACHEVDVKSPRLGNADTVANLCARYGHTFSLELFDPPHVVEATADSDPSVSYSVRVGCRVYCLCDAKTKCLLAEASYVGMAGERIAPDLNPATVRADYLQLTESDETRGTYAVAAKMCLTQRPAEEKLEPACADPASRRDAEKRTIFSGEAITVLGETSGALIPIGCEFHCPCGKGPDSCRLEFKPIGLNATTFADVAHLKRATPTVLRAALSDALPESEHLFFVNLPAHRYSAQDQ